MAVIGFLIVSLFTLGIWVFKAHARDDREFQSLVLERVEASHATTLEVKTEVAELGAHVEWLKRLKP